MNNNIIVDSLIETFHHPSRRLISNSLHFSSSQCCILIIKIMDIIVTTLLLHDQFYYSTLDIDRYLWEQRKRGVYVVPMYVSAIPLFTEMWRSERVARIYYNRVLYFTIRSDRNIHIYIKRTGTWYRSAEIGTIIRWESLSRGKSSAGQAKGNERNIRLRYEGTENRGGHGGRHADNIYLKYFSIAEQID